jgi:hypothetical protein
MRNEDRSRKAFNEAATALSARLERVSQQMDKFDKSTWQDEFVAKCETLLHEREREWSSSWPTKCNGKRFLMDLYPSCGLSIPPTVFKRRLLQENKFSNEGAGTESWKLLQANFSDLFKSID